MRNRRELMLAAAGAGALPLAALLARGAFAQPAPQLVKLVAQKFHYTPAQFHVKAGLPVTLEFTAVDFVHGFSMPDLDVRADLTPGPAVRVNLPALKPGVYDFLCDNFCGDEHETMHGRMIVEA